MKRKLYFILVFLFATASAQSQIRRFYLDESENIVDDLSKAKTYVKMMQDASDSTWKTHQYSLTDTLLAIGSFKDEQLTIPHGKFTLFNVSRAYTKRQYNNKTHQIENFTTPTAYWLDATGSYVNGQKDGEWSQYANGGGLYTTTTWKDGKRNGPFKTYSFSSQKPLEEGNYVNGRREGIWITFSDSGTKLAEKTYVNDQIKPNSGRSFNSDQSEKRKDTKAPVDFKSKLSAELKNIHFGTNDEDILLNVKTTTDGTLVCEGYTSGKQTSEKSVIAVIDALGKSSPWTPATKNGEPVEQTFGIYIKIPSLEIKIGLLSDIKNANP